MRSPRRRESLHALVDVGPGTLDFTTFNVWRNEQGDDVYQIVARSVKPLGTSFLVKHRLETASDASTWHPSPFEDVPSDAEFVQKLSMPPGRLKELDNQCRRQVADVIRDRLSYTKQRRTPLSLYWDAGVPTFLCGGGAGVNCYINVLRDFAAARPPFKINPSSLAAPGDLKAPAMPRNTYDRLSVAYGLSYIPDDIGKIFRMEEIDDYTQVDAAQRQSDGESYRERYVDKDMV